MVGIKSSLLALSLVGMSMAAPLSKRATTLVSGNSESSVGWSLYAFGEGISGSPVFFADDLAFIGDVDSFNGSASVSTSVTFYQYESLGAIATSTNSTTESFSSTPYLYILPEGSSQVGFTSSDASLPSGATTTGWDWYGNQLMWDGDSSDESYFFAKATDVDGIYSLLWVDDGSASDDLIVLKINAKAPSQYATGEDA